MENALPEPKAEPEPNALPEPGAAGLAKGFADGVWEVPKALVAGGVEPKALVVGGVEPNALVVGGVDPKALGAEGNTAALGALAAGVVPKAEAAGLPKALCPNADWDWDVWPKDDCPKPVVGDEVEVWPKADVVAGVDV